MSSSSAADARSVSSRLSLGDEGHAPVLRPQRFVDPKNGGNFGVRSTTRRLKSFRVDLRLQVPTWRKKKHQWGGSYPERDQAKRAVDALLYYSGETPHHNVYPRGFFSRAPPRFEGAPETEEFLQFLRSMAKTYAADSRPVPQRRPSSGEVLPIKREDQTASEFDTAIVLSEAAVPIPAMTSTPTESSSKESINLNLNREAIRLSSFTDFEPTNQTHVVAAETVSTPSQLLQIPQTSDASMDEPNFDNDFSIAESYGTENYQTSTNPPPMVDVVEFWRKVYETTLSNDDANVKAVLSPSFMIGSDPKAMPGADDPASGSITPCAETPSLLHIESQQSLEDKFSGR